MVLWQTVKKQGILQYFIGKCLQIAFLSKLTFYLTVKIIFVFTILDDFC